MGASPKLAKRFPAAKNVLRVSRVLSGSPSDLPRRPIAADSIPVRFTLFVTENWPSRRCIASRWFPPFAGAALRPFARHLALSYRHRARRCPEDQHSTRPPLSNLWVVHRKEVKRARQSSNSASQQLPR
jgi:hypothetical protein